MLTDEYVEAYTADVAKLDDSDDSHNRHGVWL